MSALLGGMGAAAFLRRHWQKRPLLVRQAIPGFAGIVDRDRLFGLATREDATSRLVVEHPRRKEARWERHDGPFGALEPRMLPPSHWTLLVHGVESLVPGGWELLRGFSFLPAARIDDLMVSYAADGGSVGPHDDRYDVFLLQGPGRRRWQISTQADRRTDPRAAIRVLSSFVPEAEWVLEPGDMLYLPPGVAHWGIAEGPCFTYSIGFLAPSHRELVGGFLGYLAESLVESTAADAIYEDPDLAPARDALEIGDAMVKRVSGIVGRVDWGEAAIGDFLGCFLTRPRAKARFEPPARAISADGFAKRLAGRGRLALALPSRGLLRRGRLFLNGEGHAATRAARTLFHRLVTERALELPVDADARATALLHAWHAAGYVSI